MATFHPERRDTGIKEGIAPPMTDTYWKLCVSICLHLIGPNLVTGTHLTEEDMEIGSLFQVAICPAIDICPVRYLGFYY